jgi:hypothetical protein
MIIRYLVLFFILSVIYILCIFGGAVVRLNLISFLVVLFLIIPITPFLGKLILKESTKIDSFYISYIILIAVILPTSGDFAATVHYPYFIFDMMEIKHFNNSKNGVVESYLYPMLFIPAIGMVMLAKFLEKYI